MPSKTEACLHITLINAGAVGMIRSRRSLLVHVAAHHVRAKGEGFSPYSACVAALLNSIVKPNTLTVRPRGQVAMETCRTMRVSGKAFGDATLRGEDHSFIKSIIV